MGEKSLVGPLIGILVAVIVAVAVVIPVAIDVIDYRPSGTNGTGVFFFGVNTTTPSYNYLASAGTVANLFPLLIAVLVLVGIAGYMTLQG
jgi:hypothetical protein